ncbi:MAG: hypothetical protein ACPGPS_17660, partial [Rubripirellula sp.]
TTTGVAVNARTSTTTLSVFFMFIFLSVRFYPAHDGNCRTAILNQPHASTGTAVHGLRSNIWAQSNARQTPKW